MQTYVDNFQQQLLIADFPDAKASFPALAIKQMQGVTGAQPEYPAGMMRFFAGQDVGFVPHLRGQIQDALLPPGSERFRAAGRAHTVLHAGFFLAVPV
jgi:hypothetical protein